MGESENTPGQFPRLAISDFLLLTLCVGLAFSGVASEFKEAFQSGNTNAWNLTPPLIDCFAAGVFLFALIAVARSRLCGIRCPASPGHWLVLAHGPYTVMYVAAVVLGTLASAHINNPKAIHTADNAIFMLLMFASVAVSARGLTALERRWQCCILLIDLWLLASVLWMFYSSANILGFRIGNRWGMHVLAIAMSARILAGMIAAVAMVLDLMHVAKRDWLHYLAVSTFAFQTAGTALSWGGCFAIKWWGQLLNHLMP